jgi:FimV-like protein
VSGYQGRFFIKVASVILCTVLYSSGCFAVGFGTLKIYSHIGEPLDAEVELLAAEDLELEHIRAGLGSSQDFKRAGLQRSFTLNKLRFAVERESERTFIQISSDEILKQPVIDLLIALKWPGGSLVRGYALLLDPAPTGAVTRKKPKNTAKYREMESLFEPEPRQELLSSKPVVSIAEPIQVMSAVTPKIEPEPAVVSPQASQPLSTHPSWIWLGIGSSALIFIVGLILFVLRAHKILIPNPLTIPKVDLDALPAMAPNHTVVDPMIAPPLPIFADEMSLKLELAQQYLGIGEMHSARALLEEVCQTGGHAEMESAMRLIAQLE